MKCNKRKFSKFEAMLYLVNSEFKDKQKKGRTKRKECRYYYCRQCNAYHLTSMDSNTYRLINDEMGN